jgi:hypothetical protein
VQSLEYFVILEKFESLRSSLPRDFFQEELDRMERSLLEMSPLKLEPKEVLRLGLENTRQRADSYSGS